jgi:hypothetical protein
MGSSFFCTPLRFLNHPCRCLKLCLCQICVHVDISHRGDLFPPFPAPRLVQAFDLVHWCSRCLVVCNMALLDRWRRRDQRVFARSDRQRELRGDRALPAATASVLCSCCGKVGNQPTLLESRSSNDACLACCSQRVWHP